MASSPYRLHMIRHAKSSWSDSSLSDIKRPLSKRGMEACKIMATKINYSNNCFKNIFCSPAQRAQLTLKNLKHHLNKPNMVWHTDPDLYTFSSEDIWEWVNSLPSNLKDVTIVGHNPAFTDFVNEATEENIFNIPTCGYAQLQFPTEWKSISLASANLNTLLYPKMYF